MEPKDIYSTHRIDMAPSATDFTIYGAEVAPNKIARIETFFCTDLTTAGKVIRLGFKRRGIIHWLCREDVSKGDSVNKISKYSSCATVPIILVGGEQPVAMVESPTDKDEIHMVARGPYI